MINPLAIQARIEAGNSLIPESEKIRLRAFFEFYYPACEATKPLVASVAVAAAAAPGPAWQDSIDCAHCHQHVANVCAHGVCLGCHGSQGRNHCIGCGGR